MEGMERTIERIKKLMALAMSDPDTPEAKSAALKAAELLAKYKLDMADLTEENKNDVLEEQFKNYDSNNGNWEKMFLSVLMNVFDIHVVVDKSRERNDLYRLFGKKQARNDKSLPAVVIVLTDGADDEFKSNPNV